jgi:hypothetical protein
LLDEYLRAAALDRLGLAGARLSLRESVGRVVLVDVEPARRADPPVPLVLFNCLPLVDYEIVVRELLTDWRRGYVTSLRATIDESVQLAVGVLSPMEAVYFYVKALSLCTGAYNARG